MEILFIIVSIVLLAVLVIETAQYKNFLEQRDLIIQSIIELQMIVNNNADTQEKMRGQQIVYAQEIDMIEKVLGIHAQALKLLGPVLPVLDLPELGDIAKTKNF